MLDRPIESAPRPPPADRAAYRMRDGHRREYDARKATRRVEVLEPSLAPAGWTVSGLRPQDPRHSINSLQYSPSRTMFGYWRPILDQAAKCDHFVFLSCLTG